MCFIINFLLKSIFFVWVLLLSHCFHLSWHEISFFITSLSFCVSLALKFLIGRIQKHLVFYSSATLCLLIKQFNLFNIIIDVRTYHFCYVNCFLFCSCFILLFLSRCLPLSFDDFLGGSVVLWFFSLYLLFTYYRLFFFPFVISSRLV